jgi:hypothetical protein
MQDREQKGRENRNSIQAPVPPSDPSLSAS